MKKLFLIFLLAFALRLILLGKFPVGFHADEARAGWNAYSILKTLHDDRGNMFALYYNTFGDYRPTGIFYTIIPFLILFGKTIFAVRFSSSFFGALTIFPIYFLSKEFFENEKAAILSALLLALSPWDISLSRATSEGIISMFFALTGVALFIKAVHFKYKKWYIYSFLLIFTSYFFYHSIRLLAPLFLIAISIYYWPIIKKSAAKKYVLATAIGIFLATLVLSFSSQATARLSQISITKSNETEKVLGVQSTFTGQQILDNKFIVWGEELAKEYAKYFSLDFFIGENTKPLRYMSPHIGILTYSVVILLGIGSYNLLVEKNKKLPLLLLFLSPIPAALTVEDSPNMHRALFMLPFILIIAAYGFTKINKYRYIKILLALLYFLQVQYFLSSYFTRSAIYNADVRNHAASELALYLNEVHENYEEVIVTHDPDEIYPWFFYLNNYEPSNVNPIAVKRSDGEWKFQNILFTTRNCPSGDEFPGKFDKPNGKNILVVDGFKCSVESKTSDGMQAKVIKQLTNPDGSIAYTLWGKD